MLVSIDDIALDVAQSIINIQRYLQLNKIAEQQIAGIQRIQKSLIYVQMLVLVVRLTRSSSVLFTSCAVRLDYSNLYYVSTNNI